MVSLTGKRRRAVAIEFDPGYARRPYSGLVASYPAEEAYPANAFRLEWGPVFHRGRLDGSARVLVIGQDPATHEAICRRILVGEAGQRVQGFLARLGITHAYVMVNALLYSVYGQQAGNRHIADEGVAAYRNRWLDALVERNELDAIVTLGGLAHRAYEMWRETPAGAASTAAYANIIHPTFPESASRSGDISRAAAMAILTRSWNAALDLLHPVVRQEVPTPLVHYGSRLQRTDTVEIPACDLPAGLPAWMRSLDAWAARRGTGAEEKRATLHVVVPRRARTWVRR